MVCAMQYFTMALTTVYAMPCSSNDAWDRSSIPLVDGYPYGLRDAMLVDSCSDGLHAAILQHDFDNGLHDAMLVEWRIGSLIDSAHQRLSLRFARRHAHRVERRLADVEAEDDAGSKVSEWELREHQDREEERRAEKLGAEE